jgi:ElaA protein
MSTLSFQLKSFDELSTRELYAIWALRNAVFIVEQNCPFQDADGKDFVAQHCLGTDAAGTLVAYTRLFAPDAYYVGYASIGRVVTAPAARRTGAGRALMQASVDACARLYGPVPIQIGAQKYLLRFYESFGFRATGDDYWEDGILHTFMIHPGSTPQA